MNFGTTLIDPTNWNLWFFVFRFITSPSEPLSKTKTGVFCHTHDSNRIFIFSGHKKFVKEYLHVFHNYVIETLPLNLDSYLSIERS